MCLIVLAWRAHPDFPLVVAANRDEFHARPAAPADFWSDQPGILAGRDLPAHYGQLEGVAMAGRPSVLLPSPHATSEQVDEGLNFLRNLVSSLPTDRP